MDGILGWLRRETCRGRSDGQVLIEALIALALLGIIATTFMGAVYTSLHSARIADERAVALTLTKSELEFVKQQSYSAAEWAYEVDTAGSRSIDGWALPDWWGDSTPPALSAADFSGYSVHVTSEDVDLDSTPGADEGIRKLTATAFHYGEAVESLENYEVDR